MKIRINNRINDMPLRCFEFSPMAKEMRFDSCNSQSAGAVQLVRGADTLSSADSCNSQSAGAVQLVRGADTAGGCKNHIKQLTDIVSIKDPTDIVSN